MDFIILLGLKFFFDLMWPEPKHIVKTKSNDVEAAFWFGTSYENIDKNIDIPTEYSPEQFTENSEYDHTW